MTAYSQINNINSAHFEAIFFYATTGILITDESGKIAAVNPFALKEFGYTEKELVGKKIELLVPPRFRQKHNQYHKEYIKGPHTRQMNAGLELFARKKDGTEFPVEISLSNYSKDGEKYVIAFVTDISVRKSAETEIAGLNTELKEKITQRTTVLKETIQKLEDAQAFQKALFDNAGAMIMATDEKGIITFFNPEASRRTGYNEAAVINNYSLLQFHDKKEIVRKRQELLRKYGITVEDDFAVLVEKSKRSIHEEEQYTYTRNDNTTFPVSLTITAIRNNEGTVTGFIGIAIDISERKKAEDNLLQTLRKEKELGDLKSRFVSMASHEFRTPLSTVLSSAYLIEKYATTNDQPKREKHLQRIIGSVSTLSDILNDFLSVGRIEEGKIQVRPVEFNTRDLIIKLVADMKSMLKAQQKISYRHLGSRDVIMDASLLKHIVMNLVSNASKFSREGSLIEIRTVNKAPHFSLTVKDHGIGISKEDQKHLMERFFRGANAGNIQGTGLGLHIVSKYAELMNGTVHCNSELEKGTVFTITFTLNPD